MRKTEYKLLSELDVRSLNISVSKHLSEGWSLYGNPNVSAVAASGDYLNPLWEYIQAVVKWVED